MVQNRRCLLLLAPVLVVALSGCGVWDTWKYRTNFAPVAGDESMSDAPPVLPGHSTDPDTYNEEYVPYDGEPTEAASPQRYAPPPAPPVQNEPTVSGNESGPSPEADSEEEPLIKTLKAPRFFSPESVRSIYDRFRGSEADKPARAKLEGPIARRRISESPNRHCQYDASANGHTGPVQLGKPEAVDSSYVHAPYPHANHLTRTVSSHPVVMQACPSSFRHPLLADPTGVPYRSR